MTLPTPLLATSTTDIDGTSVPITSLSRNDVTALAQFEDDIAGAEAYVISKGTGVTLDEAAKWRTEVSAQVADNLLNAISVLSGLRPARDAKGKA